jgi:DNA-nicking Smr family endonuclease
MTTMKNKRPAIPHKSSFSADPFKMLRGIEVPVTAQASPPPVTPPPVMPPSEDADDLDLFFRAVSDVRPLPVDAPEQRQKDLSSAPPTSVALRTRTFDEEDRTLFLKALVGMDVRFEDGAPDEADSLRPISASRLKQLRQGTIRINLELDLHGLTRDMALENLGHFIDGAWRRGMKAVLVITGKGNNSPGEPVLQAAVAGWLREKGKKMVVEFAPAPRQMGGTGAFVVFLRPREHEERMEQA